MRISKFGTIMPYLGILGLEFKKLLSYMKSAPSNLSNCKISQKKQKSLNLGPKMPYLGIFWLEFEKIIVIFDITTTEFA